MKIGIIGTGNIGSSLARKLSAAGHEVRVANSRGVDGVREFADEIGAQAVDVRGAVDGAEVIVLSIPLPAVQALPADLFDSVAADAIVIDTDFDGADLTSARLIAPIGLDRAKNFDKAKNRERLIRQ